jgi:hypothetical protein
MMKPARGLAYAVAAAILMVGTVASPVRAEKVILRIRAGNPLNRPQPVEIKSVLPEGISTNHILSTGGLDVGYDVDSGNYYVHRTVDLGPKEIAEFNVELQDIWTISEAELEGYRQKARVMAASLKGRAGLFADAERLRQSVEQGVQAVIEAQGRTSLGSGADPIDHIRAYQANLELLTRAKKDVARIENLVIAAGGDPGALVTPATTGSAAARLVEAPPPKYGTATITITARNTSTSGVRRVFLRQDLPLDVELQDVLDPAGLSVAVDPKSGATYVYREGLEIEPLQSAVFAVKIRDKWNVHAERLRLVREAAQDTRKRIADLKKFPAVEAKLGELIGELGALEAEPGPATVNEAYVAHYRSQGRRLDQIAEQVERIKSILQPVQGQRWGVSNVKPPTPKTTWLLIYGILGFLALLTVVFMLRWMVRGRAERAASEAQTPPETP